jgi:NAD(P)-dependent dehydrogenase (short-subunit alcohol dehydrogenase family)
MQNFKGKVAVVTGGASGIGKALSKALLRRGAKVVIADVEDTALKAATEELGGEVSGVRVDVRDPESMNACADAVYEQHGACHLLFNNAGVGVANLAVWETEPTDWQWVHGVNVNGVVHGIQAFVPRMIAGGEEGFIVNTSSGDGGISPLAEQCVYASSKAAVSILTECLAAQFQSKQLKLGAGILYPAGGLLKTGIWTTKRNRPDELSRDQAVPEGSEMTFDQFMTGMKAAGMDFPVQDLDELAEHCLDGVLAGDFVIMLGREGMEEQLVERARKLARGECPVVAHPGMG